MISNKFIVDKATAITNAGNLTEMELAQLAGVGPQLRSSILTVNNLNELPDAAENLGRMFYVVNLDRYYFSDGVEWINDYHSTNLRSWGYNYSGQLGDNTSLNRSSPVSVVGGIANWSQVSAGGLHSLGLTTDGKVYAWGYNGSGQLGDNTTSSCSSPVSVTGGITNWSQVSAGFSHSLGLTTNGVAYAWGYNVFGQLGDNTVFLRGNPVSVVGGITNWKHVSAGQYHSMGVTTDGKAYAWGHNSYGQLGDNTTSSCSSPVSVTGGITNWSQVSAGFSHSLGLTTNGVAYAWGYNGSGRLGTNDIVNTSRSNPGLVVGGITNWSQVSAGSYHSLGVTTNGIAYAWGSNGSGQLGDNTTSGRSSPVSVIGGITNWSQVAAGGDHSLGLTTDGVAYAWGYSGYGQLGDSTITPRSSPVSVVGGIANWSQVSAGQHYSLGIGTFESSGFKT